MTNDSSAHLVLLGKPVCRPIFSTRGTSANK
jgi:hypothetical protein